MNIWGNISVGACKQKIPDSVLNDPSRRNPNIKLLTVTVEGFEFTQEYPTGELLGKNYKPGMGLKPLTYGINDYMLLKPVCTNIAGRMQPGCVGFCGKWCKNNQKPWKEKCLQFDDCQGCNACREGEFATCPVLCRLRKDSWAKKCKALPICAQCAECAQERRKIFSRSMQVETGAEPLAAQAAFKSAQALGKNPPGLPGKAAQECTQVNACAPVSALNASMGKVLHPVSLTIYKTVTMEHFARTSRLKIGVACKNAARRS